jgi:hypothetical protein
MTRIMRADSLVVVGPSGRCRASRGECNSLRRPEAGAATRRIEIRADPRHPRLNHNRRPSVANRERRKELDAPLPGLFARFGL